MLTSSGCKITTSAPWHHMHLQKWTKLKNICECVMAFFKLCCLSCVFQVAFSRFVIQVILFTLRHSCYVIYITSFVLRCRWGSESCYPESWRCDFEVDCRDGSDELHCSCPDGAVTCGSNPNTGLTECVNMTSICDGQVDCFNGLDESNCSSSCGNGTLR